MINSNFIVNNFEPFQKAIPFLALGSMTAFAAYSQANPLATCALGVLSLGALYKTFQQPCNSTIDTKLNAAQRHSWSNIILDPLTYSESMLGKMAALTVSIFLTVFSIGLVRYFCTDYQALLSAGVFQTPVSRTIHSYPGDLTTKEKSELSISKTWWRSLQINSSKYAGFNFTIREQNLFNSNAQVIVNPGNPELVGGGGVDGAIHAKGGTDYTNAHKGLKKAYGGDDSNHASYPSGHAAMIKSGKLIDQGIENVIVVNGPQGPKSDFKRESQLYSTYYNSLILASANGKNSIALPWISTGIYNFPRNRAAAVATRAVFDFMNNHPETTLRTISIHALKAYNDTKSGLDYFFDAVC